jgi:hypothetical protein
MLEDTDIGLSIFRKIFETLCYPKILKSIMAYLLGDGLNEPSQEGEADGQAWTGQRCGQHYQIE